MNAKIIISTILTTLALTACSTTPTNPNAPIVLEQHKNISSESTTLEQIKNIETFPESSLGNQAILHKNLDGSCTIEFTGFYTTGKIIENWQFRGEEILNASSTKLIYTEKTSLNSQNKTTNLKNPAIESLPFNIQNPEKIQNFIKLKSHFNPQKIEPCR